MYCYFNRHLLLNAKSVFSEIILKIGQQISANLESKVGYSATFLQTRCTDSSFIPVLSYALRDASRPISFYVARKRRAAPANKPTSRDSEAAARIIKASDALRTPAVSLTIRR